MFDSLCLSKALGEDILVEQRVQDERVVVKEPAKADGCRNQGKLNDRVQADAERDLEHSRER